MSEVSNTPQIDRPPQTGTGPVARSERSGDERQQQSETPERQQTSSSTPTATGVGHQYEPALELSPSVARLYAGKKLQGAINAVHPDGHAVLKTDTATFIIRPDVQFEVGEEIAVRITRLDRAVTGLLIARNAVRPKTPEELELKLISFVSGDESTPADKGDIQQPSLTYAPSSVARYEELSERPEDASSTVFAALPVPSTTAATVPSNILKQVENLTTIQEQVVSQTVRPQSISTEGTAPSSDENALAVVGTRLTARFVATGEEPPKDSFPPLGAQVNLQVIEPHQNVPASVVVTTARVTNDPETGSYRQDSGGIQARLVPKAVTTVDVSANRETSQFLLTPFGVFSLGTGTNYQQGQEVQIAILPEFSQPSPPVHNPVAAQTQGANLSADPTFLDRPNVGQRGSSAEHRVGTPTIPNTITSVQELGPDTQALLRPQQVAEPRTPAAIVREVNTHTRETAATAAISPEAQSSSVPATALAGNTPGSGSILTPPLLPLPLYLDRWPVFDALRAAASDTGFANSLHVAHQRLPQPGVNLPNTLLFFLNAVSRRNLQEWLTPTALQSLTAANGGMLIKRLQEEFSRLGRILNDVPAGEWRAVPIPIQLGDTVQAMALLFRMWEDPEQQGPEHRSDDGADENGKGSRFLLELRLSRIGRIQIEGLIRGKRFDLIIRSQVNISPSSQREIDKLFSRKLDANELFGDVKFETGDSFPIDPAEILQSHDADSRRTVTV